MLLLGLNAFHADSSAALIKDGRLVAAAEEERFRRIKHWAGFPSEAIAYCLREAGATLEDVDHVAFNQNSRANLTRKVMQVLAHPPSFNLLAGRLRSRRARTGIPGHFGLAFVGQKLNAQIHAVEHHAAHLSSAFHVSPFDHAAVASVDGFGDFSSGAWGIGSGSDIRILDRVYFPHSLGIFYQALTQYLGFPNYGDEYKIMGLAPYGQPTYVDRIRKIIRLLPKGRYELDLQYFRHHRESLSDQWIEGSPKFERLFSPALELLLGPSRQSTTELDQRHHDIARSVQEIYEESFLHLLRHLHDAFGGDDLALAGGCAMNSVANGKIRRMTPFKRVYVQAAAGDAGGAIGSALVVWHKLGGKRIFRMDHAYWGPQYRGDEVRRLIAEYGSELSAIDCIIEEISTESTLCDRVATQIAAGKVVGWFQGRMEWGPRALGNRSILGDPRRHDMKQLLNEKIKRRESFRPFAPSILEEAVIDWFEENDAVPFMMQVFQVRKEKQGLIPAVTHVDGSGRLQTVSQRVNERYYRLIKSFETLTGIPMLLNTSFNENEPIVCEPKEALECFLRTRMDLLVIGDMILERGTALPYVQGSEANPS